MKRDQWKKEEIAEDYCFICKDGGLLRVCDFKKCLKAYHPHCVGKDDSFLENDDHWTCGSHSCSCRKSSSFQCFCCPVSYCNSCIVSADFVHLKKKKGFCINCLRLSKMIEEDRNVDSDGEEVDFNNSETYEFLFKDYWEIVKEQEGLTIVDVQSADALLKRGENFQDDVDSDKEIDEEWMSDLEDDYDDGKSVFKCSRGKQTLKTQMKKSKKGRTFIGWASEELVTFLAAIGKNSTEPLSQVDVTELVKDYVQSKDLFQPNKRRKNHVVPDETLYNLFRKKKLKYHKIFDLVKSHLAEEQSDPSDHFSLGSEEDEGTIFSKKRRITHSDSKTPMSEPNHCRNKVLGQFESCHAAIIADNIRLTYLRKSLMLELLKCPETFEDKVVGCFVRIKNDPKGFYYLVQKAYQLGQVTGIKKAEQPYKIGEWSIDIVLRVSNFSIDIKISMLSDEDIEEEECEDLRQLVKKGLFTQPTVAALERKIISVHEDIVNHWINREIGKLQKQIDRANEKGWRKELGEYIDRRQLLRTPEERLRLIKEIPKVIPDSTDNKTSMDGLLNLQGVNKGVAGNGSACSKNTAERKPKGVVGNTIVFFENGTERKAEGVLTSDVEVCGREVEGDEAVAIARNSNANVKETVAEIMTQGEETVAIASKSNADSKEETVPEKLPQGEETVAIASKSNADSKEETVPEKLPQGNISNSAVQMPIDVDSEPKSKISEIQASPIEEKSEIKDEEKSKIKDEEKEQKKPKTSEIQIIDLDQDDDDITITVPKDNGSTRTDATPVSQAMWHYRDPSGNEQGPFTLYSLWYWRECGYFDENFKVWKSGQYESDAILLTIALGPLLQKR